MRAVLTTLRQSPLLLAGLVLVAAVAAVGLLAPWLAPYDPKAVTGGTLESPSSSHLLGTNNGGFDLLSRLIWGTRTTLLVAVCATVIVLALGTILGLTAGLRGGLVDTVIMRTVDLFLALPVIPLLIFIIALAGPSLTLSILLVGLSLWPQTARVVRSQTLTLRQRGFMDSARGFGGGPLYVMRRHLVPALGPIIGANLVFVAGLSVTTEAALSFLGLGDPEVVSWGAELNRAMGDSGIYLGSVWLWWVVPFGLALTLAILGLTLIGVALEPRLNPRWSRA